MRPGVRRARRRRRSCARCLREVLGLERVGIDDNFFALGGDSIMSIQLVSRARQAGLVITPRAVFQHQTVAALAAVAAVVESGAAAACPDIAIGDVAGDADHALAAGARRADRSLQPGDAAAGAGGPAGGSICGGAAGAARSSRCAAAAAECGGCEDDVAAWRLRRPARCVAADCLRRIDVCGLDDEALRACIARAGASGGAAACAGGRA